MNFDDTPREAEFRAEAKAWIAAHAPKQYEDELKKSSLGRTQLKGANILDVAKTWQKQKAEASRAVFQKELAKSGMGVITSEIIDAPTFFYAEDYHQQYLAKNPNGYCGLGGTGVSCG